MRYLVITAVGKDRPGLVAGITEALLQTGCNVEDSTMTRLRGDFAMILLIRHPDAPTEPLLGRLDAAQQALDLTITAREVSEAEVQAPEDEGDTFHVSVYGADRAGIVHAISARLAARGADIVDLRTTVAGTAEKPIYVMQIEALAAPGDNPRAFVTDITQAGAECGVDVVVQQMDPVAL